MMDSGRQIWLVELHQVSISRDRETRPGKAVFELCKAIAYRARNSAFRNFDISPDGETFLMVEKRLEKEKRAVPEPAHRVVVEPVLSNTFTLGA